MTIEVSGFRGFLREVKALPWIGGLCYMGQVTLLGAREVENNSRVCHPGPVNQRLCCVGIPSVWHPVASQRMCVA